MINAQCREGKVRQVRVYCLHGGRGSKETRRVRLRYPFGEDGATWDRPVEREGDVVIVDLPWHGMLIGERMDVNEGSAAAEQARALLGRSAAGDDLPMVYSSGDSISLGYWPYLEAALIGHLNVYYQRELWKDVPATRSPNNGHAHHAMASLKKAFASDAFQPDVLLINFGLHMVVPFKNKPAEYEEWIRRFAALAKEREVELIWLTTTPYSTERAAQNKTIERFNAGAQSIAKEMGFSVIDLHGFVRGKIAALGEAAVFTDGVHFTEDIKKQQGAFIAGKIRASR